MPQAQLPLGERERFTELCTLYSLAKSEETLVCNDMGIGCAILSEAT